MSRLLVAVVLLHHIEGVCKPLSAAGRVVMGLVASLAGRDRQAASDRAATRKLGAVERARLRQQARGVVRRSDDQQQREVPRNDRPALERGGAVTSADWRQQAAAYRDGAR